MDFLRSFGAWKKKSNSTDVIWRGFDAICVCVLDIELVDIECVLGDVSGVQILPL